MLINWTGNRGKIVTRSHRLGAGSRYRRELPMLILFKMSPCMRGHSATSSRSTSCRRTKFPMIPSSLFFRSSATLTSVEVGSSPPIFQKRNVTISASPGTDNLLSFCSSFLPLAGEIPLYTGNLNRDLAIVCRNRLAENLTRTESPLRPADLHTAELELSNPGRRPDPLVSRVGGEPGSPYPPCTPGASGASGPRTPP
jgi:hypothetical protein